MRVGYSSIVASGLLLLALNPLTASLSLCELVREPRTRVRDVEDLVLRGNLTWVDGKLIIISACSSRETDPNVRLILSAKDRRQEQALLGRLTPPCDLHMGCSVGLRLNGQFEAGSTTSGHSFRFSEVLVAFAGEQELPVVPICKLFGQIEQYAGKRVAIRGLLEGYGKWQYLRGTCDSPLALGGGVFPKSIAIDFGRAAKFERNRLLAGKSRGYRFVDVEMTMVGTLITREHYESRCTSYGILGIGFGSQHHPAKLLYETHFDVDVRPSIFHGAARPDEYRPPCPVRPREGASCESVNSLIEAVENDCSDQVLPLLQGAAERVLPDQVGQRAKTPLYSAVYRRNRAIVELLVKSGENVNEATVFRGNTPLCLAAGLNDLELARYLLEHSGRPNPSRGGECAPLVAAAEWSNPDMIELLIQFGARLDQRDRDGKSALDAAYAAGRSKNMKTLVDLSADTNAVSAWGLPLLLQILRGPPVIGVLDAVLQSNVQVDVTESNGVTPLMIASREAWAGVVKKLIDAGADANRQDNGGQTPLMHAVRGGYLDAIPVLLCAGADATIRDHNGQTAKDLVGGESAEYLANALGEGCKQE